MLKQAVFSLKTTVVSSLPFCGPPLDCGLSLLSRQACQAGNSRSRRAVPDGLGARLYCKLADAGRFLGETAMNEVAMVDGSQTEQILHNAIAHKVTAIMSYLSKGKWHVAKVLITAFDADRLSVQTAQSHHKNHPININIEQPVGISFKYEYGKFVFDATVTDLQPATEPGAGGTIVLKTPQEIEVIQRRSYFRVEVPDVLKVKVTLWHRRSRQDTSEFASEAPGEGANYSLGTLADISAGGAQVVLDATRGDDSASNVQFRNGQFIGMRFTPLPYETPLVLTAQIRNVLPRADGASIYLGLQIVGLEASPEGRRVLARLVGIVERYYKMNQAAAGKKDASHAATTA
jgi:hypothetical protein